MQKFSTFIRKWSRSLHRDLSFFFAGVLLIYAVSGFMLNHKKDFHSDYIIRQQPYRLTKALPANPEEITREMMVNLLKMAGEEKNYLKHYSPSPGQIKIFIKGGSSMTIDTKAGTALYESIRKRPVISSFNRLHYNPSRWWTVFSDIFILSLVVITLTGLIMLKGPKGFWGRGGIEFITGLLIPLCFIFFS